MTKQDLIHKIEWVNKRCSLKGEPLTQNQIELLKFVFALSDVSITLSFKDKAVNKGFNNANSSEYNRRNVLKDADDDLYYTGWMDCFDWLISNDN